MYLWRKFGEYVPVIHYGINEALCKTKRARGKGLKLTLVVDNITCKRCLAKHKKSSVVEYFDGDLFKI
jgi:hypothetical protein